MKVRKIPVEVEAVQWTGLNLEEIKQFVGDSLFYDVYTAANDKTCYPHLVLQIETLEGDMLVSENDFIIKGVNGEFYPCKPDIFKKTYEIIE